MSVEDVRVQIRRLLEEKLGVDEATYLMDRPAGGWSDLVTWSALDARLDALEARIGSRFSEVGARFSEVGARFSEVGARFSEVGARFTKLEARMDAFDEKLVALESRLMAQIERRFRVQTAWLVVALGVFAGILKA
ncbi:MAG: hypothetical protein FJW86_05640 [Actinobacteria bacterium]|nr:hypothetical protein [Actinomycetota bacterium]